MPNGRTDIFELETDRLLESLGLIETDASIGTLFDSGSPTSLNVSLAELRSSVRQHGAPRITIEEQHGCEFIVHTGHPVGGWVCINQSSPVFTQIRGLHSVEIIAPIHDAAENKPVSDSPSYLRSTIAGILGTVAVVSYLGIGLIQIAAVFTFFHDYWGWWLIPSFLASVFVGYMPIVGSVAGIIAATNVWEWPLLLTLILFFFPLSVLLILGVLIGFGSLARKLFKRAGY